MKHYAVVLVCHQGIGDLIAMSGGIIYLTKFYNEKSFDKVTKC